MSVSLVKTKDYNFRLALVCSENKKARKVFKSLEKLRNRATRAGVSEEDINSTIKEIFGEIYVNENFETHNLDVMLKRVYPDRSQILFRLFEFNTESRELIVRIKKKKLKRLLKSLKDMKYFFAVLKSLQN